MLNKFNKKTARYNREQVKDINTLRIERAMFVGTLV